MKLSEFLKFFESIILVEFKQVKKDENVLLYSLPFFYGDAKGRISDEFHYILDLEISFVITYSDSVTIMLC